MRTKIRKFDSASNPAVMLKVSAGANRSEAAYREAISYRKENPSNLKVLVEVSQGSCNVCGFAQAIDSEGSTGTGNASKPFDSLRVARPRQTNSASGLISLFNKGKVLYGRRLNKRISDGLFIG